VEEFITLSMQLHLLFVILLVVLIIINLYLLKSDSVFIKLSRKLELIAPQYYIVLSAIFFTGIIVMAVKKFAFSLSVWMMILVWLFILVKGIKKHKIYKKMEKRDENSQVDYKKLAIKKYTIDAILIIVTIIFTYGVH